MDSIWSWYQATLHSQSSAALTHVNEARKQLFAQNRKMENIPPTLHALEQPVKRAVYQTGHIWGQSLIGDPEVSSAGSWGWKTVADESSWTPCWTTLLEAAQSCQELLIQVCTG